jgi:PAT family beta-lactamase induction signal transducer AmpG
MSALTALKKAPEAGFDFAAALREMLHPAGLGDWLSWAGLLAFAAVVGLITAAVLAARHGAADRLRLQEAELEAKEGG